MKKFLLFLSFLIIALIITPLVSADFGPKRTLEIEFNESDQNLYVTVLSKDSLYGPHLSFSELYDEVNEENIADFKERIASNISDEVFMTFFNYQDIDNYYLSYAIINLESAQYNILYYPPTDFKLLIYDSLNNKFIISEIYETYAFNSYYFVDLNKTTLELTNNYDYLTEIISLIVRIVVTVLVEIGIALLFKFNTKKDILIILFTNIVTQVVLNLGLNIVAYYNSFFIFEAMLFILAELLVFVLEAIIYCFSMKDKNTLRVIAYSFIANLSTFILGIAIYLLI